MFSENFLDAELKWTFKLKAIISTEIRHIASAQFNLHIYNNDFT